MENYVKKETSEKEDDITSIPFTKLPEKFIHLRVKRGTKIRNIIDFAMKKFKVADERILVCSAVGPAIGKAISCIEIIKRKHKECHQVTKLCYKTVDEIWEPKIPELDELKVSRKIPAIHMLLSKDPLDTTELGYQAPGNYNAILKQRALEKRPLKTRVQSRKKKTQDTRLEDRETNN